MQKHSDSRVGGGLSCVPTRLLILPLELLRGHFLHTHTHTKYIDKGTLHLENAVVYIPYRPGMKLRDVAIEMESLISVEMTGS